MYYLITDLAIFNNGGAIINGIDITDKYKRSQLFTREKGEWSIYIQRTEKNAFKLVLSCKSRKEAYYLLDLIKCFYTVIIQILPLGAFDNDTQIIEFMRLPKDTWTKDDWLVNVNSKVHNFHEYDFEFKNYLDSGLGIFTYDEAEKLINIIKICYSDYRLIESFRNLYQSLLLLNGNINSSYYNSHYQRERPDVNKDIIEKAYYENREKYELSFIAAFKAIERLLNVNDIKKNEISKVLNESDLGFVKAESKYERYFEIFNGNTKYSTYEEMVYHFLDIRNTVGAHANKKPPIEKIISFDSIYEVQNFVSLWLELYLDSKCGFA